MRRFAMVGALLLMGSAGCAQSEVESYGSLAVHCAPAGILSGVTVGDRQIDIAAGEATDAFVKRALGEIKGPVVLVGAQDTQERCVRDLALALQKRKVRVIGSMAMPPKNVGEGE